VTDDDGVVHEPKVDEAGEDNVVGTPYEGQKRDRCGVYLAQQRQHPV